MALLGVGYLSGMQYRDLIINDYHLCGQYGCHHMKLVYITSVKCRVSYKIWIAEIVCVPVGKWNMELFVDTVVPSSVWQIYSQNIQQIYHSSPGKVIYQWVNAKKTMLIYTATRS